MSKNETLPTIVPVSTQIKMIRKKVNHTRIEVDIDLKDLGEYVTVLKTAGEDLFKLLSNPSITEFESEMIEDLAERYYLLYRANRRTLIDKKRMKPISKTKLGLAILTFGLSYFVMGV